VLNFQALSAELSQVKPDVDRLQRQCQSICGIVKDSSCRADVKGKLTMLEATIKQLQSKLGMRRHVALYL